MPVIAENYICHMLKGSDSGRIKELANFLAHFSELVLECQISAVHLKAKKKGY